MLPGAASGSLSSAAAPRLPPEELQRVSGAELPATPPTALERRRTRGTLADVSTVEGLHSSHGPGQACYACCWDMRSTRTPSPAR